MKRNKGVSLIVLVVTIIVMIIIAGAVIISLTDTNVIEQAEYASESYRVAMYEEKINLARQEKLLAEYGTTEGVNISVRAILDITEENEEEYVVNIATANSIPANMPAGTYYKLDENRYATKTRENERELFLASRGIDRENELVTNTYVVNENFDVYYIISGTIGQEQPEINDEKVIEIVEEWFTNWELTSERFEELKKELHIENLPGDQLKDISISFYDEEFENECVYFPKRDRLYMVEWKEVGKDAVYTGYYISREERPKTYEYAEKLQEIEAELNTIFVGKTEEEMEKKYNDGLLEEYIVSNCKSIKSVRLDEYEWDSEIIIRDINFEFDGKDYDEFCGYNTFWFALGEDGKFSEVYLQVGA